MAENVPWFRTKGSNHKTLHVVDSTNTDEPTKTESDEPSETSESSAEETEESTETDGATKTEDATGTETEKETKSEKTSTEKATPTSIDPRKPPGGIEMVTPPALAPTTYVKMGEYATFKWNYTSLIVTPAALDVVAYCKKNDHSYTIAGNESVKETGSAVWDTSKDMNGDFPLMNELYTLQIYDSELGPSEIPKAGHLGNLRPFIFGVYSPKPTRSLDGMSPPFPSIRSYVHISHYKLNFANHFIWHYRWRMRNLQIRRHLCHGTPGTILHVQHGYYYHLLIHLVRQRFRPI